MFTGIVRERGTVVGFAGGRLRIEAPAAADESQVGDSISIDGVCLTVVEREGAELAFDVVPETVARTALSRLDAGTGVNMELPVRPLDRLGGHVVQGHVDAVGLVRSVAAEGDGRRVWIDAPPELLRLTIEKGSIAVAGVSLTIAALDDEGFAVALIPHTLAETTLGDLRPGDDVNLEADVLAKYVERLVSR